MKVISYPHYTCGGLLCDILNQTWSGIRDGGIDSKYSTIGKLPDVDGMLFEFDADQLIEKLKSVPSNKWVGTHCWMGNLDLDQFEKVINVTTLTYKSRLYRWMRASKHWYSNTSDWQNLSQQMLVDKQRETAKNYLKSFPAINHQQVINLEFADVVEMKPSFLNVIGVNQDAYLEKWKSLNQFLYDHVLLSDAALRFHEAEYESISGKFYVYQ